MDLLLDTNVLIWLLEDDPRLSRKVRDLLNQGDTIAFISVVSGWEYGQKRLKRPGSLAKSFDELLDAFPHVALGLEFDVYRYAESLPPIHSDPFDRMLIAQATHHGLHLVASDETIHRYPVRWFW